MPTYNYECDSCGERFQKTAPMSQYKDPQECPNCKRKAPRAYSQNQGGFILEGDGWAGKNIRVKNQMAQKNRRLAQKEREFKNDAPGVRLAPNVDGQRVDSWSEASKLAASKGKNTAEYDKRARTEKK